MLSEEQVGEGIAQFGRQNTDSGTGEGVAHPVTVVQNPHAAGSRSHHIPSDTVPWTSCETILLVQDGGCCKGRCRMPRREGVAGRAVRTLLTGSVLDAVHKQSHDSIGCCRTHGITSPRTASFHPRGFQSRCQQQRGILQVIVCGTVEIVLELLPQTPDIRPLSSQCGSGNDPREAGKREVGARTWGWAVLLIPFRCPEWVCFCPCI